MGMGGMPGMGNMDPALMSQLMSNPAVANSISQMFSNPALLDMMAASNPQLGAMLTPEMRAMMQSEGFRRMMSNPDMVRSMMQMGPLMGGGMNPFGPAAMGGAYGAAPGAVAGVGATPGTTPATAQGAGTTPLQPTGLGGFDPALLSLLMGGGLGGAGAGGFPSPAAMSPPPANPEEAYQGQLRQLQDMGFYDASENIRALTMTRGNVEAAVEWLLSNPPVRR
jgi:ubiquilin